MAPDPDLSPDKMGLLACLSFVVGNVVGSGIFIAPGPVLILAGSIGLCISIWAVCGLFSILGGIVFIELGTGIPSDGGDFAYAMFVGWESIAFSMMAISGFVSFPGSVAIQATTFGLYMADGLEEFVKLDKWKDFVEWVISCLLLVTCTLINCFPVGKGAAVFQIGSVVAKTVILIIIVFFGLWKLLAQGDYEHLSSPFEGSKLSIGAIAVACYSSLWGYAGWDVLNAGAPSVKKPKRNLPIALVGGLILVTVIYLLTNFAFAAVVGVTVIKESKALATDFAKACMGPFYRAVPFGMAIMLMSTANSTIFGVSRILYKAAEEGHLPKFLAIRLRRYHTPIFALIVQLVFSLLFTKAPIIAVINYCSVVMWLQKGVSVAAILYIRYKKIPLHEGAIRIPIIVHLLFFCVCLFLVVFPMINETRAFLLSTGAVLFLTIAKAISLRCGKVQRFTKLDDAIIKFLCRFRHFELSHKLVEKRKDNLALVVKSEEQNLL